MAGHPTVDDLALTRLLTIALLTPAQAVALGADLLADLADVADRNAPGPTHVRPATARVGRDGRARLTAPGSNGHSGHGAGLASVAALLDDIGAAIRPAAADDGLVSALERAEAEARAPDGQPAIVAAILREADAPGGAQARAELARVVAMVSGEPPPARATPPAPRRPEPRGRRRRPPRVIARTVVARSWRWALSLAVLLAVIAFEIIFLRDEIGRDIVAVLEAGRSEAGATSAAPTLPPVLAPAPATAGPISRVGLRPVQPCTPGADCVLRVQVIVQPQPEPHTVTWEFRIVDRCSGATVTEPGGTITVPPHADRTDAVSTVALPRSDALGLHAVTSPPFAAASAAVLVPAPGACTT